MASHSSKSISRRAMVFAAAGAAPLLLLGTGGAKAAGLPPTAVGYQATPKDGKKCGDCKLFVAPNACKSVTGDISANGWCKLYAAKA